MPGGVAGQRNYGFELVTYQMLSIVKARAARRHYGQRAA